MRLSLVDLQLIVKYRTVLWDSSGSDTGNLIFERQQAAKGLNRSRGRGGFDQALGIG